ncbi:sensor histidine kinase [Pseudooceanicola algae]|uniref:histidine kinase n=1 Tax=Pseudooceanicola algae TaxID=1537215 RepID=A0A418SCA7_9RHOB|nr:HAMP domain-containing sensor histidine kinase [Pseudooceanicola algae]QPM90035.1 Adaptive-response sensory-kinase SasA [Pseudooceanicola algae]
MSDQITTSHQITPAASVTADEVEELIYVITHDLRGSFRAIQLIPDFIREDLSGLPPLQQEVLDGHVGMLKTIAGRCDRMLVDLRDYSRIGRCADPVSDHAVSALLDHARADLALSESFDLTSAGSGIVTGPRNELNLLFACLISNAVKHHDQDRGTIRVAITTSGQMQQISISDDGPGIPAHLREEAFGVLRTLKSRDVCEGSGMGLPIARKIITRLGGSVTIGDNPAGRGTRITLTLPGHPGQ